LFDVGRLEPEISEDFVVVLPECGRRRADPTSDPAETERQHRDLVFSRDGVVHQFEEGTSLEVRVGHDIAWRRHNFTRDSL
jgi:hypothetical protein